MFFVFFLFFFIYAFNCFVWILWTVKPPNCSIPHTTNKSIKLTAKLEAKQKKKKWEKNLQLLFLVRKNSKRINESEKTKTKKSRDLQNYTIWSGWHFVNYLIVVNLYKLTANSNLNWIRNRKLDNFPQNLYKSTDRHTYIHTCVQTCILTKSML